MYISRLFFGLSVLLTLLILAGCSSGPGPVEVAKAAFESTVSADMNTAKPLYCEKMQSIFPSQEEMDALQKELNVQFTFDFSKLAYEVKEESEGETTVGVSGTLRVTTPQGSEDLPYDEVIHLIQENGKWLVCEE